MKISQIESYQLGPVRLYAMLVHEEIKSLETITKKALIEAMGDFVKEHPEAVVATILVT